MNQPLSPEEKPGLHPVSMPRKWRWLAFVAGVALLAWVFSGYFSPQIMIDFVMRYCA